MECEDSVFSVFLLVICAVWGVFCVYFLWFLYYFMNFLTVCMFFVGFFKFLNALGLVMYFGLCLQRSIYWAILALCAYPMYHSFLLTVFMLVSKGYLIVFPQITERDSFYLAGILSVSYLVYSISLINSSAFAVLVILFLSKTTHLLLRSCENILIILLEKLETVQVGDLHIIENRIFKYKTLKNILFLQFLCEFLAGAFGFVTWSINFSLNPNFFIIFQFFIESYRLIIFLSLLKLFSPYCHQDQAFHRIFSTSPQEVRLIALGSLPMLFTLIFPPLSDQILLGEALN